MWADNETSEDLLGFKVHADLLVDVIKDDSVLPVTIGVFGDWGSGKSSILKIVEEELTGGIKESLKDGTLVLYFNGWVFEGYDDAKAALLESIIEKFDKHKTIGNKVKDKTANLLKSVKWMRLLGLSFKNIIMPSAAAYLTGGVSLIPFLLKEFSQINPNDISDKLQGDGAENFLNDIIRKKEDDSFAIVREFREEFNEMIEKSDIKKLVVIIDDLDRCTPDRIIENLEAIKLFLNVPKTAFIIGADPRIVKNAIEHKYKKTSEIEDKNNRIISDYLEKLIQVPYSLPKLSEPEVETYISLLIAKKELDQENFTKLITAFHSYREKDRLTAFGLSNFKDILGLKEFEKIKSNDISIPALFPLITQSLYGNPRQIKRFLNTYTLRQRLAKVAKLSDFKDMILAKLMVLEYSEPDLFKQLYDWQSTQEGKPKQLKTIESICFEKPLTDARQELEHSEFKSWKNEKIIKWLQIAPQLSNVDLREYFWISRDDISSLTSDILISPFVKNFFNDIIKNHSSETTKRLIAEIFSTFNEIEQTQFFNLLASSLLQTPENNRIYSVFTAFFDTQNVTAVRIFKNTFVKINKSNIEPAVGIELSSYKNHPLIGEFLVETFKDDKTKSGKAFNLKRN